MLQDLKFGLKLLLKDKAFTVTALLTLALCIGANTAIYTVLNAVVLNPLPFSEPEQLVTLYNVYPGVGVTDRGSNGVPDYLDRKKMTDVFDSVALIGDAGYDIGAQGSPLRIDGQYVTPSYFRVLRVSPFLGRGFAEDDAVLGKDKIAILSYGLWKDTYAGDRNILGKDIRLSGTPYKVVGVMPEGFGRSLGNENKIWVPFAFTPQQTSDDTRHSNSWQMIARLKPDVTIPYAQQRIDALNKENLVRFPKYRKILEDAKFATKVVGLKNELIRDVQPILYLLQGAVVFVLLIGCVNVANLMLVRSNIRMKELGIRFSLGAGRGRIARQLLTESLLLAILGGTLGVVVGFGGVRLLTNLGAKDLPRGVDIQIDAKVLLFSAAVAVVTGLIFGSLPIVQLLRRNLNDVFRQVGRTGTTEKRSMWTRSALVVCQLSLAFVLLIGSGLLTMSFARLLSVDPGFRSQNVVTARFSLPEVHYKDNAQTRNFVRTLLENVRSLPGVHSAGVTTFLPFGGFDSESVVTIEGHTLAPGELPPVPQWNTSDAGYFQTLGIPLLAGRAFSESDGPDAQKVTIIDQFLAHKYWPKGDAIGHKIRRGMEKNDPVCTIIGVVGSVKVSDLAQKNQVGTIYFPFQQVAPRAMHLVVKTEKDDPSLTSLIRRQILQADPELPLFDTKPMQQRVTESLVNRRAAMVICLVFAGLALTLSAIGIYGVLAYTVSQRTREFGIRVALGASMGDVIKMVMGYGLKLAGTGLAIGIVGALVLTRAMTSLLYEVKPTDPGVFGIVATVLAGVALLASFIPSLRAVRIKPAIALRDE